MTATPKADAPCPRLDTPGHWLCWLSSQNPADRTSEMARARTLGDAAIFEAELQCERPAWSVTVRAVNLDTGETASVAVRREPTTDPVCLYAVPYRPRGSALKSIDAIVLAHHEARP